MDHSRKKILVCTDWYEPGFKAGGPIRSCVNFVYHMKSDYDLYVFTSDRDLGDDKPYEGIKPNEWLLQETGVQLLYASPGFLTWKHLLVMLKEINADFIYLNSMFSRFFALYPLLIKRFHSIRSKMILAPRGMLRESALAHKPFKKKIFLTFFRMLGIPARIYFHATDATEVIDIKKKFGSKSLITEISNFPGAQQPFSPVLEKLPGEIKMIFTGRIHPIKNLAFLLDALKQVHCKVALTLVAAIEDAAYWNTCSEKIKQLPLQIKVDLLSNIPHEQMQSILLRHHLFALPTKGENFGHAIYESLAAGRPVLISDQTPWHNLQQKKAGWDLPLSDGNAFAKVINEVAAMDLQEINNHSRQAWQFCHEFNSGADIKKEYLKLFS